KTALYSFFSRSSASASNSSSSSRWLTRRIVALQVLPGPCRFRGFSAPERAPRAAPARTAARAGADAEPRGRARTPARRRRGANRDRSCAGRSVGPCGHAPDGARPRAAARGARGGPRPCQARRRHSRTAAARRSPTARSRRSARGEPRRPAPRRGESMPRGRRGSRPDRRTRGSRAHDRHRAVLDLEPRRLLADPDAHALRSKALEEQIGRRGCERLEQIEAPSCGELPDRVRDLRVVDRSLDAIVGTAAADLEPDVEPEGLPLALLLRIHAVVTVHLESVELDDHPRTALAAASASTCSRTSCTRRIVAPRSNAATAAPTEAATVPRGVSVSVPRLLFREKPTSNGRPIAASSPSLRTSSKLWAAVLPKPMPGSRQTSSSSTPSDTANASRSSRKRFTSETTSS